MSRTDEELRKATEALHAWGMHGPLTKEVAQRALDAVLPDHDRQLLEAIADEIHEFWNVELEQLRWKRRNDPTLVHNVVERQYAAQTIEARIRRRAAALATPTEPLCDCPPATQDPSGDYCLNCGHLILAAARP